MDPGITEDTVQYETVRKMKLAFVNLYQASVDNASTAVIGGMDVESQLVTGGGIYHGWYDRSQTGMYHLMGAKWCRIMASQGRQPVPCKGCWKSNGRKLNMTR
jgi:hypothetical protein